MRPPQSPARLWHNLDTVSKSLFVSVDDYIAAYPDDVQAILERVRSHNPSPGD